MRKTAWLLCGFALAGGCGESPAGPDAGGERPDAAMREDGGPVGEDTGEIPEDAGPRPGDASGEPDGGGMEVRNEHELTGWVRFEEVGASGGRTPAELLTAGRYPDGGTLFLVRGRGGAIRAVGVEEDSDGRPVSFDVEVSEGSGPAPGPGGGGGRLPDPLYWIVRPAGSTSFSVLFEEAVDPTVRFTTGTRSGSAAGVRCDAGERVRRCIARLPLAEASGGGGGGTRERWSQVRATATGAARGGVSVTLSGRAGAVGAVVGDADSGPTLALVAGPVNVEVEGSSTRPSAVSGVAVVSLETGAVVGALEAASAGGPVGPAASWLASTGAAHGVDADGDGLGDSMDLERIPLRSGFDAVVGVARRPLGGASGGVAEGRLFQVSPAPGAGGGPALRAVDLGPSPCGEGAACLALDVTGTVGDLVVPDDGVLLLDALESGGLRATVRVPSASGEPMSRDAMLPVEGTVRALYAFEDAEGASLAALAAHVDRGRSGSAILAFACTAGRCAGGPPVPLDLDADLALFVEHGGRRAVSFGEGAFVPLFAEQRSGGVATMSIAALSLGSEVTIELGEPIVATGSAHQAAFDVAVRAGEDAFADKIWIVEEGASLRDLRGDSYPPTEPPFPGPALGYSRARIARNSR